MTLEKIADLVEVIAALPEPERELAAARLEHCLERPEPTRLLALGLLALDLAPVARTIVIDEPIPA